MENPRYRSQVQAIGGDFIQPSLGMREADLKRIESIINVVIHLAATAVSSTHESGFRSAVYTNVRATRDLIALSKRFKNLKVHLYNIVTVSWDIDILFHGDQYYPEIKIHCLLFVLYM